jgi:hypothetical protein
MADLTGSNGARKEFNAIGKPRIPGKLSHSLATGKAKFGTDAIAPNMLYAKSLRSPDASKGKASPGVGRWPPR